MVLQNRLHETDKGIPYVAIDDIPFRVVDGSFVQVSPLAPFSSALQAGSSSRISDSRLSVEVWDNFSGGIGLRDETDQQVTSYAEGNFDTRVPGYNLPPPFPAQLTGPLTGFTANFINVEHLENIPPGVGTEGLLLYAPNGANTTVKVYRSGVYTSRPSEPVYGFTPWRQGQYYIGYSGGNVHLYSTSDGGATWSVVNIVSSDIYFGLTVLDNRLITYDWFNRLVKQSLNGTTFSTHSVMPDTFALEGIEALFTWYNPSRTRDTLWAVTSRNIIWYEEESGEWHVFYPYEGLLYNTDVAAHVWRRDENLYVAPLNTFINENYGFVQMFTGQVADDVSPNERFGLPDNFIQNIYRLKGGAHWLYAFATGVPGGIFALNEFQGWSQLFDPRQLSATFLGGTGVLAGGGYANGKLWAVVNDGGTYNVYQMAVPDRRQAVPLATNSYIDRTTYLRSAWTSHNQTARWKIASYFEVDFRTKEGLAGFSGTVGGDLDVTLLYRTDKMTNFVSLGTQTVSGATAANFPLKFQVNVPGFESYRQLQWEVRVVDSNSSNARAGWALASVALYYSFWQGNYYAYQFNIDLTPETWYGEWPDMDFRYYDRDELIAALFGFNESKTYHTFRYKVGAQELYINKVDLLVAGREDAEVGGGIYSVTVRNLDV